ncbi:mismatch-specific DNA-glycosylase [Phaeovulum sp. W22_SRMD_FR3]|uniref:mismatch-specific DNA-glycosylase n=1 Tax=Phaeovulum sp. W22_SRMD_FR3 TaxID=3240274 RepID=UPI003F9D922B
MAQADTETGAHKLPDRLGPGLDLVFCGTAAGAASARAGHYYAGPGNRFWPLLAEAGITPRLLRPDEDHLLLGWRIGLTDLAKTAAGADREIPRAAYNPDRLRESIRSHAPRALAFTSLTAARLALGQRQVVGPLAPQPGFGPTQLWVLPSPSGLARGHFSADPWLALGRWLMKLREERQANI